MIFQIYIILKHADTQLQTVAMLEFTTELRADTSLRFPALRLQTFPPVTMVEQNNELQ